jgi:hypothetical protein
VRAYSFASATPDDIHSTTIDILESELKHRFESLAVKIKIPNQIYLVIITQ